MILVFVEVVKNIKNAVGKIISKKAQKSENIAT